MGNNSCLLYCTNFFKKFANLNFLKIFFKKKIKRPGSEPIKFSKKKKNSPDSLVDDDSNGSFGDVEDSSGSSVVSLEWHTLLEGSIGLDVDQISALVLGVVGGEMLNSVLAEVASEHVTRSASETLGVSHILPAKSQLLEREYKRSMRKHTKSQGENRKIRKYLRISVSGKLNTEKSIFQGFNPSFWKFLGFNDRKTENFVIF